MDEEEDEPLADDSPFVLCPSTFEPNKLGRFRIIILTEHPLAQVTPARPSRSPRRRRPRPPRRQHRRHRRPTRRPPLRSRAQLPTEIPKLTELRREGRWLSHNAGGCRNYVTWRKNEQYLLRLTKAARASVREPDARRDEGRIPRHIPRLTSRCSLPLPR